MLKKQYLVIVPAIVLALLFTMAAKKAFFPEQQMRIYQLCYFIIIFFFFGLVCMHFIKKHLDHRHWIALAFAAVCISALVVGLYSNRLLLPRSNETIIKITALGEKNEASAGTEVWISELTIDDTPVDLSALANDSWESRDNVLVSYQKQPACLTYTLPSTAQIKLSLVQHGWSGQVEIETPTIKQHIDLYSAVGDAFLFQYKEPYQFTLRSILWAMFSCLSLSGLYFFLFTLYRTKHILAACLIGGITGGVLKYSDYMSQWDNVSILCFILVLCYIAWRVPKLFNRKTLRGFFPTKSKKIVFSLIVLYTLLACTYNQIVITPHEIRLGMQGICYLLLSLAVVLGMAVTFLSDIDRLRDWLTTHKSTVLSTKDATTFWLALFFIVGLSWGIYLIAFDPAVMSPDSISQWKQAIGASALANWHPLFHTMQIRICAWIYPSPTFAALMQLMAGAAIWATGGLYLYRSGLPRKAVMMTIAVIALCANNGLMSVTLWKDVAYAFAIFALIISLAKISKSSRISLTQGIVLVVALCYVAMVRHNGIIPAICTITVLSIFYLKRLSRLLPVLALLIVMFVQNVIYPANGISPPPSNLSMASPMHGIGAVIYYDGELDDVTYHLATDTVPKDVWNSQFNPYLADPYSYSPSPIKVGDLFDTLDSSTVLRMYVKTLLRNPFIVIHERLANADINWSVQTAAHPQAYISRWGLGIPTNDYVVANPNKLTSLFTSMLLQTTNYTFMNILLWRSGIYFVLLLLLAYYAWLRGFGRHNLVMIPLWTNYLVMFLGTNAQDYRYSYSIFFCFPFILLWYSCQPFRKNGIDRHNCKYQMLDKSA